MATLLSAGLMGVDAYPIHVEVDITRGFPAWSTVGLAESAVKESKERVLSAIANCGYNIDYQRITLNLAPADIKKSGTAYDLPIAVGLLAAGDLLPRKEFKDYLLLGELSLNGKLRPIRGALSVAILAKQMGLKGTILPFENVWEANLIPDIEILGAPDLPAVVEFLLGQGPLSTAHDLPKPNRQSQERPPDFCEVKGQAYAKRALEVAAAGFHNVLLVGPPGTGKSMLASRLPSILPQMSFEESLSTTKIYSLMGLLKTGEAVIQNRPFRTPHHTISDAGLIGGGTQPRPGEVSLAHNGVLFLDELTEFKKHVLESLRQPLEAQSVTIARAMQSLTYPARFLLAAAMNPCPCGHFGNPQVTCLCSGPLIQRYQSKISGPLLDRIDLQIDVPPLSFSELSEKDMGEPSDKIRERVQLARERQLSRFKGTMFCSNSQMGPREIRQYCELDPEGEKLLELAIKKWGLSARAFNRILKVARTIADFEGSDKLRNSHLSEAIGYRSLDKKLVK
jgi:magnesium chelatase family protein